MNELRAAGRLVKRSNPALGDVELVEFAAAIEAKDWNPETRSIDIVASDETVDRYGDVISANGWRLDNYRKNPVVLIDHNYTVNAIVGTASMRIEGTRLIASVTLDDPATNRQASIVANLITSGSLRAMSVGFIPIRWETIKAPDGTWLGFKYTEQELTENSFVAVPANPNAVVLSSKTPDLPVVQDEERLRALALRIAAVAAGR